MECQLFGVCIEWTSSPWCWNPGSEYCIPLLWDVEDVVCLAYRGFGPLLHQLSALRGAKGMVRKPSKASVFVIPSTWNCPKWTIISITNELFFFANYSDYQHYLCPQFGQERRGVVLHAWVSGVLCTDCLNSLSFKCVVECYWLPWNCGVSCVGIEVKCKSRIPYWAIFIPRA